MINIIELLKCYLHQEYHCKNNSNNMIKLTEAKNTKKQGTLCSLLIGNTNDSTLIFSIEDAQGKTKNYSHLLNNPPAEGFHYNAVCDYLIYHTYNSQRFLLICELKSKRLDDDNICNKFIASNCFVNYCHELIEHCHDIDSVKIKKYNIIFNLTKNSISSGRKNKSSKHYPKWLMGKDTKGMNLIYAQVQDKAEINLSQVIQDILSDKYRKI